MMEPLLCVEHSGLVALNFSFNNAEEQEPLLTNIVVVNAFGPVTVQFPVGGDNGDCLNTEPLVYPLKIHLVVPLL